MARAAGLLLAPLLTNCLTLEKFPDCLGFYELETWIGFSRRFAGSWGKPGPSLRVQPDGFIIWELCAWVLRFWHVTRWKHNGSNWVLLWVFGFSCTPCLKARREGGESNWRKYRLGASRGKPDSLTPSDWKLKAWLYVWQWILNSATACFLFQEENVREAGVKCWTPAGCLGQRISTHKPGNTVSNNEGFYFLCLSSISSFLATLHPNSAVQTKPAVNLTAMYLKTCRTGLLTSLPDVKEIPC